MHVGDGPSWPSCEGGKFKAGLPAPGHPVAWHWRRPARHDPACAWLGQLLQPRERQERKTQAVTRSQCQLQGSCPAARQQQQCGLIIDAACARLHGSGRRGSGPALPPGASGVSCAPAGRFDLVTTTHTSHPIVSSAPRLARSRNGRGTAAAAQPFLRLIISISVNKPWGAQISLQGG